MTQRPAPPLRRVARALGPAISAVPPREALRAGLGAAVGLGAAGLVALSPVVDLRLGLAMIAPFGATAVLIFAAPNSPLAQPWSAVVGNTLGALVGVAACLLVADPGLRVALAVGLTVVAMGLARAVHPPAGAVAMTAALSPEAMGEVGFRFALAPVALGTALLVGIAMVYARLTGRRYPFRHPGEEGAHGTSDPPPAERLGLSEAELSGILRQYRQSLNLGVEDLARLIGAAEMQAASHAAGPVTAADIMSRDLVTVGPEASLAAVADLVRRHGFTSLPVVGAEGRLLGVIFQLHLVGAMGGEGRRGPLGALLRRPGRPGTGVRAAGIMSTATPTVAPGTPVGALLPLLAEDGHDAVPVVTDGRIVGIVTQTDLITALARQSLRGAVARQAG